MKKIITLFGSLMIIAGLKAQKDPVIKKETTPAVKVSAQDSMKIKTALPGKQLPSSSVIPKLNPVDSNQKNTVPSKYSPVVKPEKINPGGNPESDFSEWFTARNINYHDV